uniref:Uncharacterized protein n=1 Tax=Siphoviridae sp. ctt1f11 TaxID=2827959 RepID=A0A8S5SDM8_9CAUD|nr:MAG TPA: hypothetical protein [Siphoviridae sp. ctt1f11]DAJ94120.1 MAG TPA: hypothetical protein [Caudoviricetes sp.]DAY40695.1 MAG TPA: hypothetical protein [Caudoviricetes sp.]
MSGVVHFVYINNKVYFALDSRQPADMGVAEV